MKTRLALITATLLFIVGCVSFTTSTFRAEQTAVDLVYTAYQGYTNGLASGAIKITAAQSNEVKQARLKFAATVATVEQLRVEAETNSTVKPLLQNTLDTLSDQSSNVVWLINFIKAK